MLRSFWWYFRVNEHSNEYWLAWVPKEVRPPDLFRKHFLFDTWLHFNSTGEECFKRICCAYLSSIQLVKNVLSVLCLSVVNDNFLFLTVDLRIRNGMIYFSGAI